MQNIIKKCPICQGGADWFSQGVDVFISCSSCGRISIQRFFADDCIRFSWLDMLSSYLYYNGGFSNPLDLEDERFFNIIGNESFARAEREKYPYSFIVTKDIVETWYPRNFEEQVDCFLSGLYKKQKYNGQEMLFTKAMLYSACFVKCENPNFKLSSKESQEQADFFLDYLKNENFIKVRCDNRENTGITLLHKGLSRIDAQRKTKKSKHIFVSMSFAEKTAPTREAIRQGIIDAGFLPDFIDEIIHNHQIVPEMFRLIRESRLLVLEISDPNYGAYYEAGYALGLGKEVIVCCSSEMFNKKFETAEEKKFERYLKPHFDISQKQILIWNDESDLTKKLSEWIKALA